MIVGHIANLQAATEVQIEEGDAAIFAPLGDSRYRLLAKLPASAWRAAGRALMQVADELRAMLGDAKVTTSESVLDLHAGDLSYHPRRAPVAVVFPESTEDVSRVLAWANERRRPRRSVRRRDVARGPRDPGRRRRSRSTSRA